MARNEKLFRTFWDAYGLKLDRIGALSAWNRLSAKDQHAAIAGIETYRSNCLKQGVRMMYGQGYLSHHRWEDELVEAPVQVQQPKRPVFEQMSLW